jgi:hypothetical protein
MFVYCCGTETGWPDWAYFRLLDGCLLWAAFENYKMFAKKCWLLFIHCASYVSILTKYRCWALLWSILLQTLLVTLDRDDKCFVMIPRVMDIPKTAAIWCRRKKDIFSSTYLHTCMCSHLSNFPAPLSSLCSREKINSVTIWGPCHASQFQSNTGVSVSSNRTKQTLGNRQFQERNLSATLILQNMVALK